jgi:hypothetical protein
VKNRDDNNTQKKSAMILMEVNTQILIIIDCLSHKRSKTYRCGKVCHQGCHSYFGGDALQIWLYCGEFIFLMVFIGQENTIESDTMIKEGTKAVKTVIS